MAESTLQPDAKLIAVITAAVTAALASQGDFRGFRVVSIEQAKAEGMG